jgi:phosphoribosylformylglycinamidine synthase
VTSLETIVLLSNQNYGAKPMVCLEDFWKFSKVVMTDTTIDRNYTDLNYSKDKISTYLEQVLQLEAVAVKTG